MLTLFVGEAEGLRLSWGSYIASGKNAGKKLSITFGTEPLCCLRHRLKFSEGKKYASKLYFLIFSVQLATANAPKNFNLLCFGF